MFKLHRSWILAAAVAVAIGCGGGGGGSTPTTGATNGNATNGGATNGGGTAGGATFRSRVGIFVTDALGAYDHVWVTIKKVEVVGTDATHTVFEDAAGKVVDLVSLNQAGQQQFALLGVATIPAGTYSQIRITVAESLTTFAPGATAGEEKTFAASENGEKRLSFAVSGNNEGSIVADFDLSQWTEEAGVITAVVVSGDDGAVNEETQQEQDFDGAVSNLGGTAPNLTFDIAAGTQTIHIQTSATTTIANSDGMENPTLANGKSVRVTGVLDTNTQTLRASHVSILATGTAPAAEAEGKVTTIASDGFTLEIVKVDGFVPSATTVGVQVATTTAYIDGSGIALTRDEFFAALAVGAEAEAEGTYDATTNRIDATTVKLEVENEGGHGGGGNGGGGNGVVQTVKVIGPASAVDATAKTFKITIQKWEGALLGANTVVDVVTNAGTDFRDVDLDDLDAGARLEVRGTLVGTTLTATRVKEKD